MRGAAAAAGRAVRLSSIGVGSPGVIDEAAGAVSSARNLPGWEGSFPLAGALQDALGAPVRSATTSTSPPTPSSSSAPAREFTSLLGVFWGTGVGGGIVLDAKPWSGRGAAGEIGHVVVEIGGARAPAAGAAAWRPTPAAARWSCAPASSSTRARKTDLFEIMEERGRPRLTSGIWARALERDDDAGRTSSIDRAIGRSAPASPRRSTCSTSRPW